MTRSAFAGALKLAAVASASVAALGSVAHAQTSGTVQPYYGNLRPFYGDVSASYGNLRPFYGNLRPFYGNLRPFWGDTSVFWGNLQPFAQIKDPNFWGSQKGYVDAKGVYDGGQVGAFWNTEGSKFTSILGAWNAASSASDYASVAQQLAAVISDASSFWGASVQKSTGKTFATGFSNAFLASHGVDLSNPSTLASLDPSQQAMFFLDWYDGLMSYAGAGHVDWWMGATGWTPNLANTQAHVGAAGDQPVTVGMLDFTVSASGAKNPRGTVTQYGSSEFGDGHGAAVGSLIMSSIDGSGIMGVMPAGAATIDVYDPYDSTGTTNWTAVGQGIDTLTTSYFNKSNRPPTPPTLLNALPLLDSVVSDVTASLKIAPAGSNIGVINASLGEPGWTLSPGWNQALASGSAKYTVLVVAAGNTGTVQPADVQWNFAKNPTLLVVGSVGLDGKISNFSNTPGDACLVDSSSGQCDPLKNHFLVAPGELILVSDGHGGVTRQTGTSLAAPLVAGAVSLLEARWPWLASYPDETAQIILKSATPMHSPGYTGTGPDPVYGWGELNIAASQQPLDWRNLQWMESAVGGLLLMPVSASKVVSQVQSGSQATWNSSRLYFTALEKVGSTYRDFEIPMASSLVGQNVMTYAGVQMFQSYVKGGLQSWVAGGAHFNAPGRDATTESFVASSQSMGQLGGMDLRVRLQQGQVNYAFRQSSLPIDMDFALVGDRQSLRFGFGGGAEALNGQEGLSGNADFQLGRGGANPLLGLAAGGAYADWRVDVAKGLSVSFGATERRDWRDLRTLGLVDTYSPAQVYGAHAETMGLDYALGRRLTLHASLTQLREDTGLLGVQSLQASALQNGSSTRAESFGVDYILTPTLSLSASGTMASTHTVGQQSLTTVGGLTSTAAEIAVTKAAVFDKDDRIRLTLSKPMQVISGQVQYVDYGVVDRQTGLLGPINETAAAANGRTPFAAELFYGRLLDNKAAEASVFLRAGVNTAQFGPDRTDYMVGYRYKLAF